ncbi:hypothetical protein F5X68DRAFT_217215 [Plectosphaerella plurivora]|uniref:Uncharacterized protein n=1 Tax=Plectosphaerella plurivora TaxID=936078 RepID=A0A9P8V337_9PEZI|nr:hypothetical protein F5X68DRAFT_217215 [Plectosphaerella plurivora]
MAGASHVFLVGWWVMGECELLSSHQPPRPRKTRSRGHRRCASRGPRWRSSRRCGRTASDARPWRSRTSARSGWAEQEREGREEEGASLRRRRGRRRRPRWRQW